MYPLGHYGMALLFAAPGTYVLPRRRGILFSALAVLVSTLPDADLFVPYTHHHGGMHTLPFVLVGSVSVGLAFTGLAAANRMALRDRFGTPAFPEREVFGLATAAFAVSMASHLLADAVAVPVADNLLRPFWPVSDAVVEFYLLSPGDPLANVGLFAAGLTVQGALLVGFPEALGERRADGSRSRL